MVKLLPFLISMPSFVLADGYVNDRKQWVEMNEWSKDAYVAGFIDGFGTLGTDDIMTVYVQDLIQCLYELKIFSTDLVAVVDEAYKDLDNWDKPPKYLLLDGARKICLDTMNGYRAARGDTLLKP